MKAIVGEWTTDIIPTDAEVKEYCKPGAGADTCVFLLMGHGWQCAFHNRFPLGNFLDRVAKGETVAKRLGCDKVAKFDRFDEGGTVEF